MEALVELAVTGLLERRDPARTWYVLASHKDENILTYLGDETQAVVVPTSIMNFSTYLRNHAHLADIQDDFGRKGLVMVPVQPDDMPVLKHDVVKMLAHLDQDMEEIDTLENTPRGTADVRSQYDELKGTSKVYMRAPKLDLPPLMRGGDIGLSVYGPLYENGQWTHPLQTDAFSPEVAGNIRSLLEKWHSSDPDKLRRIHRIVDALGIQVLSTLLVLWHAERMVSASPVFDLGDVIGPRPAIAYAMTFDQLVRRTRPVVQEIPG